MGEGLVNFDDEYGVRRLALNQKKGEATRELRCAVPLLQNVSFTPGTASSWNARPGWSRYQAGRPCRR